MVLRITASVYDELLRQKKQCNSYSKLFLLGKNKHDVCVSVRKLKSNGNGCAYMPGASAKEIIKTMLEFVKHRLTVGGFAYVSNHNITGWDNAGMGYGIFQNKNTPFLIFHRDNVTAEISANGRVYDIKEIKFAVVNKNFGNPKYNKQTHNKKKETTHG